ncbi:MAG: hypothetical protein WCI56_02645 [Hyphomicrobiales bacterium]
MALEIDAVAVLRAINAHHVIFSDIRAEATKAAGALAEKLRTLIAKQIKSKSGTINSIQDIRRALGGETFNLVIDGMKDTEIKVLVSRLDKHHPEQKAANAGWRRRHLRALVDGSARPSEKTVSVKKAKVTKGRGKGSKNELEFLFDESAGAVRKR